MYLIGKIFNIIALVSSALLLVLGVLAIALATKVATDQFPPEAIQAAGVTWLVVGIIYIIIELVIIILASKARKAIIEDPKVKKWHIIMIVVGVIGDIFYLLGGIFGLVASNEN